MEKIETSNDKISGRDRLVIFVLLSGAFVAILNQTVVSPALPSIMNDLHIDAAQGQWLTTAFMLVNGIMIPITAFLINRYTTRQLFLTAMSFFAIGTIFAAMAYSFPILLLGRIVQAIGAGILMPMIQTVILLIYPIEKRGAAMGMVGIVVAFGPAVGPSLAGIIIDAWNWHILFFVIAPFAIVDIIFAAIVLRNVGEQTKPDLDVWSVIFSSLGFGGLLYGSSAAGTYGILHPITLVPILVGIFFIIIFYRRQNKLKEPMLEVKILKNKVFLNSTIIGMLVNIALISATIIMPIYAQNLLHYSAFKSGLIMFPGAILMGIMSPISGNLFDRFGPRAMSIIGLSLMTLGTGSFIFLSELSPFALICGLYTVRMFGIAILMMPLTTWGLNALPNKMIAHGSAINNTGKQVAGSIGTAILITTMAVITRSKMEEGFVAATLAGMHATFILATIVCVISLVLAIIFVRNAKVQPFSV